MFWHLPSLSFFCLVNFNSFYFSIEGFVKSEVVDSTTPSRLDHIINQGSIVTEVFCSHAYCLVWHTEVTWQNAQGNFLLWLVVLHQSAYFTTSRLTFVLYCLNEQQILQIKSLNMSKVQLLGLWDLTNRSAAQTAMLVITWTGTKFHSPVESYYLTQQFGVSRNTTELCSRSCFVSHICDHNIIFFRRTLWAMISRWVVYGERKLEPVTVVL